jgi:predicted TIM-barrel fold metal-dependent hydrolase
LPREDGTVTNHGFKVFDGDGHVLETDDEVIEYYEGEYANKKRMRGLPIFPAIDGWSRGPMIAKEDTSRKYWHTDARVWAECLADIGADGSVLYPTAALAHGLMRDRRFAVATAVAYNNWLEDRYTRQDERLHGVGVLALQDPEAAAQELRRCASKRTRFCAMVLPTVSKTGKTLGDRSFWPIYQAAAECDMALALHGAPSEGFGFDHFTRYIASHTLEHPVPIFINLTDMMFAGVFDAFPTVRFAFLEGGCSWVPFMMDRMDYEFESVHGVQARKELKKRPSDYFREAEHIWVAMELGESSVPYVVQTVGSERIIYASDYPHEPSHEDLTTELPEFLARNDLSDQVKANLVHNNAKRLYRIQ